MNTSDTLHLPLEVLLVEDNAAEAQLVQLAIDENKIPCNLNLARDGEEALDYLRNVRVPTQPQRPDIIILDLSLPKKSGVEVLSEIKEDELLRQIPVIILSASTNPKDITACYRLHANCYIIKPAEYDDFVMTCGAVLNYWQRIVKLPPQQMMVSTNHFFGDNREF